MLSSLPWVSYGFFRSRSNFLEKRTARRAAGRGQQENKKSGPHFHVDSLRGFSELFTALEPRSNLFYSVVSGQISTLFAPVGPGGRGISSGNLILPCLHRQSGA